MSDRQGPSVVRETLNKPKAHHKPSLINLQEPWILQVFWVYNWYLNKSLGLLRFSSPDGEFLRLSQCLEFP